MSCTPAGEPTQTTKLKVTGSIPAITVSACEQVLPAAGPAVASGHRGGFRRLVVGEAKDAGRHLATVASDNFRTMHEATINPENGELTPSSLGAESSCAFIKRAASALTAHAQTRVSCCLLDVT